MKKEYMELKVRFTFNEHKRDTQLDEILLNTDLTELTDLVHYCVEQINILNELYWNMNNRVVTLE